MAEKSGYKKLVSEQAKTLIAAVSSEYEADKGEHGGASDSPNFSLWLDTTGKLVTQIETLAAGWGRGDIEIIQTNSRNAVTFGDPKESARFALLKDVLHEVKKQRKQGA